MNAIRSQCGTETANQIIHTSTPLKYLFTLPLWGTSRLVAGGEGTSSVQGKSTGSETLFSWEPATLNRCCSSAANGTVWENNMVSTPQVCVLCSRSRHQADYWSEVKPCCQTVTPGHLSTNTGKLSLKDRMFCSAETITFGLILCKTGMIWLLWILVSFLKNNLTLFNLFP